MTEREEGWGWPYDSKKAHYFVETLSLCRRWTYDGFIEKGNDDSPDNCKVCQKELSRRQARVIERRE